MSYTLYKGDCLEEMKKIEDGSVDMILCDLPYGTTDCAWDSVIPLSELWGAYKRVAKKNAPVVLTASQPFTSTLLISNIDDFKVEWIWKKNAGSNFGTVKFQPMKEHESVLVFSNGGGRVPYFPVMQERSDTGKKIMERGIKSKATQKGLGVYGSGALHSEYDNSHLDKKLRYPSSVQMFNRQRGLHPTQKPVALMEYLIRTYTNEGDVVMDNCMGSGTTGVACANTGRNFIGIDRDDKYFEIAKSRIEQAFDGRLI